MFESVLIANRGEIAVRVARTCRDLGVRSVAIFSESDAGSLHTKRCDAAYPLGSGSRLSDTYLNIHRIIEIASEAQVDAIHPGYGFLAENAEFAKAVSDAGFVFVGPRPETIAKMGDKLAARQAATVAGVPVVPGTESAVTGPHEVVAFAERYGYPVAVKALFGGGGRGLRVIWSEGQVEESLQAARREAEAAFGKADCYLERFLERPRHVEVQILADPDTVIHLGERDCSMQRRHQKLIEESPAPGLTSHLRESMHAGAVQIARQVGYLNAGTCEFLVDTSRDEFFFLEMNTRMQVEHPVTELVTGIDLIREQLMIASDEGMGVTQDEVTIRGHAIECRINAEDPSQDFAPLPGRVERLSPPHGPWVRFDTGIEAGSEVTVEYDSMIGKLLTWGPTRSDARARMKRALGECSIRGVPTTIPFHKFAIAHEDFREALHWTRTVENDWDLSGLDASTGDISTDPPRDDRAGGSRTAREVEITVSGRPLQVMVFGESSDPVGTRTSTAGEPSSRQQALGPDDGPEIRAPMPGTIIGYEVQEGDTVSRGDLVCVLEAMKMEYRVVAHRDGIVTAIPHTRGDAVDKGDNLAIVDGAGL